jgi:endonuclease III
LSEPRAKAGEGAARVLTKADRRERAKRAPRIAPQTLARLAVQHPEARTELAYRSPFELIVSVVLSAQTTDVGVNKATPKLFARFPDAKAMAAAEPIELEPYVATLGFFRMKARSIVGLARALVEKHGGEVPQTLDELVKLPGVGRKTANVVLGVLWNKPEGVVVDTHVIRLSQRLGWTTHREPDKIERDLGAILPRAEWDHAAHVLIFHGRRCCYARKPECNTCSVNDVCPSAFEAENVGRKGPRGPRDPASAGKGPPAKTAKGKPTKAKPANTTKAKPAKAKPTNAPARKAKKAGVHSRADASASPRTRHR